MTFKRDTRAYEQHYSKQGFLSRIPSLVKSAGKKVLEPALQLYFAATDADTPQWAKRTIYGALGYLILPIDVLPDFIPMVGFTDDFGVLVAAVTAVATHIKPEHKNKARAVMNKWFKDKNVIDQ